MDYFSFILLIIIIFLDLIVIFNPKVPLLNLFLGLFSIIFGLATYTSISYQPFICLLMLLFATVSIMKGIRGLR